MKAMLHNQNLWKILRGVVVVTIIYNQNWSRHKIINEKTSEEAFSREKTNFYHLRILGFPIYIHISKDKRNKSNPASIKGMFVGCST